MDLDTILTMSILWTFMVGPVMFLTIIVLNNTGDYEFEEHKIFTSFLTIVYIVMAVTFVITGSMKQDQMKIEEQTKSANIETIFKETGLSDLQSYFENDIGIDKIIYNKETKRIIIDTNESSSADTIAKIDDELAKNDKIKSVDFTQTGGGGGSVILIINLK